MAALLLVMVIAGALAPWIAPQSPYAIHLGQRLSPPSTQHLMGTDSITRDVFSRILYAIRMSTLMAFSSVLLGIGIGSIIGLLSGYVGGVLDLVVQRFVDVLQASPGLMLALIAVSLFGTGAVVTVCVIAVVLAPGAARVIRSAVLQVKATVYVESAASIGCSPIRIMLRHVLPNVVAPITVIASLSLGTAILIEAAMAFLGLGIQPPEPSLGGMLSQDGREYLEQQPTLAIFPGVILSLFVLAANTVGDFARDVFDPRLRQG